MDLPDEILLMISDQIDTQKDRIRLLSVCRRWYKLFFPRVYARLKVEDDFDQFDGVARLASALLHNLHLASAIREFDTGQWGLCDGYRTEFDTTPFHPVLEKISHCPEELDKWKKGLDGNDDEAWFALMLTLMPNLRVLKTEPFCCNDFFETVTARIATRQKPFDTRPALQHLEEFHSSTDDMKNSNHSAFFIPFFRLPSMKMFKAHRVWEAEDEEPLPEAARPPPASSSITELRFIGETYTRCNGSNGFATFITACKNLEIFEYQHDDCADWSNRYVEFRPRAFYHPLITTQKHSLQVLRLSDIGDVEPIDNDSYGPGEAENILHAGGHPSNGWFGCLKEFTALRELRIRLRNLLDFGPMSKVPTVTFVEILPSTLEYLSIADYQIRDFDVLTANLEEMLVSHKDMFPVLGKIEIQPHDLDQSSHDTAGEEGPTPRYEIPVSIRESFDPVKDTCEKAGIEFVFSLDGEDRLER
ncbi:hypothetical protein MW887_009944 [Aspergillus wentii]|nr:hypothetical protein MW887_009944 [Aspergillus wentii]